MTVWHDRNPQREGESTREYNARHAAAYAHLFTGYVVGARVRKREVPAWTGTIVRIWPPRWYWMNNTVVQIDDDVPWIGGSRSMGPMMSWELIEDTPAQLELFA